MSKGREYRKGFFFGVRMEIQTFTAAEGQTIRTIIKDGDPWFVAADACRILDVDRTSLERLDDDGIKSIWTLGASRSRSALGTATHGTRRDSRPKAWRGLLDGSHED